MIKDEWPNDAANAAFPAPFRQLGSGAAIDGASVVAMSIGDRFTVRVSLAGRPADSIASLAGQLVLHSHEPDETAVLDVLRRCHGQLAVAQALCEPGLFEIYRAICQLRGVRASRCERRRAAEASPPILTLLLRMFAAEVGLMSRSTKSVAWPPN